MELIDTIKKQHTSSFTPFVLLAFIYVALSILIISLVIISNLLEIPIEHFTADPAATYNAHPLTGFLSNIGALFWCACCVACLFAYAVLKIESSNKRNQFLLASGFLSLILLLDDMFMFHEALLPWYFHVPQKLVYAGYLLIILAFFLFFQKQIYNSEYKILATAVFFLSLSVLGDLILPQAGIAYLVEDGFKLFGIAAWFLYFWRVAFHQVSKKIANHT